MPWIRELSIDCGVWTAYLNKGKDGGDPSAAAPAPAQRLKARCVMAMHAPPYGSGHAATLGRVVVVARQRNVPGLRGAGALRGEEAFEIASVAWGTATVRTYEMGSKLARIHLALDDASGAAHP